MAAAETAVSGGSEAAVTDAAAAAKGKNGDKNNSSQKQKVVVAKGDESGRRKKKKPVVAKDKAKSSQKASTSGFATTDKPFATTKKQGKFATSDGLESHRDEDHMAFQGVNQNEWRIIYRMMPPKKDGSITISYYYKGRTSYVNKEGKREVPYLKGKKVTTDGTERELQAYKERGRQSD